MSDTTETTATDHEAEQVRRANETGLQPVVFIHGLWLLPSSWDRWATVFEEAGFTALTPGWPDDPETVEEGNAHPEVFAGKTVGQIADHYDEIIRTLDRKPAVIGHSFGGLLTQIIAGRDQFRYSFANAVSEEEAKELHETYAVPAPGAPLFQAAAANLNPWTEVKVDTKNPERGPLLILNGEKDHTIPWAMASAAYKKHTQNEGVTEIFEVPNRGHALTIDSGWREVADKALEFVKRFA